MSLFLLFYIIKKAMRGNFLGDLPPEQKILPRTSKIPFMPLLDYARTLISAQTSSRPQINCRKFIRYDTYPSRQYTQAQLIPRYHDASLIIKQRQKSARQKVISAWARVLGWIFGDLVIQRNSWVLLVWNILVVLSVTFQIYQIPICIFFDTFVFHDEFNTVAGLIINWLTFAILLINMLIVVPNTQIKSINYLISDRKSIIDFYFGFSLAFDGLCNLILLLYMSLYVRNFIYVKILFYLKIQQLVRTDKLIINRLETTIYPFALYRLFRMLFLVLLILIWLASIFFIIDYSQYVPNGPDGGTFNWLTSSLCTLQVLPNGDINNTDLVALYPGAWYIWFDYAFYWAIQTISTVGYGDITPRNVPSVCFANFTMLIMMFFFVLFINGVIDIIGDMESLQQKQRRESLRAFRWYALNTHKQIKEIAVKYGYSLQRKQTKIKQMQEIEDKIKDYLLQVENGHFLGQQQDVKELIDNTLTPELKQELYVSLREIFFKKIQFFAKLPHFVDYLPEMSQKIILSIRELNFAKGQYIFERGQRMDNQLFYLLKGTIELVYPNSNYRKIITKNQSEFKESHGQYIDANVHIQTSFFNFGVRQFFTREPYDYSAFTYCYCKVQNLRYDALISILKENPQYYANYCQLRDELMIGQVTRLAGEECFQCESKTHHLLNCSNTIFNVKMQMIDQLTKSIDSQVENSIKTKQKNILFKNETSDKNLRQHQYIRDRVRSSRIYNKKKIFSNQVQEVVFNYQDYFCYGNVYQP